MAMSIKKLFATDESRTTVMFACGAASFLFALGVAGAVWQAWGEVGIIMGPHRTMAVVVGSIVGVLLAGSSGVWALTAVNRLSGRNAMRCILGYFLDASALAIIGSFAVILHYLRGTIIS